MRLEIVCACVVGKIQTKRRLYCVELIKGSWGKQQKDCNFLNVEGRKWPVRRKELLSEEVPSWWLSFSVSTIASFDCVRVFPDHFLNVKSEDAIMLQGLSIPALKKWRDKEISAKNTDALHWTRGYNYSPQKLSKGVQLLCMFDFISLPVRFRWQWEHFFVQRMVFSLLESACMTKLWTKNLANHSAPPTTIKCVGTTWRWRLWCLRIPEKNYLLVAVHVSMKADVVGLIAGVACHCKQFQITQLYGATSDEMHLVLHFHFDMIDNS